MRVGTSRSPALLSAIIPQSAIESAIAISFCNHDHQGRHLLVEPLHERRPLQHLQVCHPPEQVVLPRGGGGGRLIVPQLLDAGREVGDCGGEGKLPCNASSVHVAQTGVDGLMGLGGVQTYREHLLPLQRHALILALLHKVVKVPRAASLVSDAIVEGRGVRACSVVQHVLQALLVDRRPMRCNLLCDLVHPARHLQGERPGRQPEQLREALAARVVDRELVRRAAKLVRVADVAQPLGKATDDARQLLL
mmetsp:Transcript_29811/g.81895  ORF Transcript_29811/g.81895 Transcript_29811/m.81895 type:complete len:250 (+) Transcript_29811:310-1059(+)